MAEQRRRDGVASVTINYTLNVERQMRDQAASDWRDEYGLTRLDIAPKIKVVAASDKRSPGVLTWSEQSTVFARFTSLLRTIAGFAVNAG